MSIRLSVLLLLILKACSHQHIGLWKHFVTVSIYIILVLTRPTYLYTYVAE